MTTNEENAESNQTIAKHEQAKELLLESEERYRLLCQSLGIGIGYYTLDGKVKTFNEIALKNMGLKESDIVGKSIHDLFPKNEADVYFGRLLSTFQKNNVLEFEDRVILPTGEKWFTSVFSCVKNSNGNVLGVQIISKDITERKKMIQAVSNSLKDSQRRESEISALLKASKAVLQKKNSLILLEQYLMPAKNCSVQPLATLRS